MIQRSALRTLATGKVLEATSLEAIMGTTTKQLKHNLVVILLEVLLVMDTQLPIQWPSILLVKEFALHGLPKITLLKHAPINTFPTLVYPFTVLDQTLQDQIQLKRNSMPMLLNLL